MTHRTQIQPVLQLRQGVPNLHLTVHLTQNLLMEAKGATRTIIRTQIQTALLQILLRHLIDLTPWILSSNT